MGKKALILLSGVWFLACSDKTATMEHAYTNDLIKESSPYLLQHAHNPVDWKPWNNEVLAQAQKENKPILISIGYASCHWCHVMEEECFEDLEVARIMNEHFINIKIDREERPDVDQVYMDALQLLTGRGGWPLNVVALPNGKPYWGATYLPKDQWISALTQLSELYEKDPEKIEEYAGKLSSGIKAMQLIEPSAKESVLTPNALDALVEDWQQYFDSFLGGYKRAPKFMMPNNLDFLMHYGFLREQDSILQYVNTSLTRMAYGGLFDPIDGGFSRYSVDTKWHVPHFEKMLYDNGQLISLYAKAYALTKNPLYKQTVVKTIAFVEEQLGSSEGGYYSSLDADSLNKSGELEEGAFYVWKESELKDLLGDLYEVFATYYNVNSYGHWENGNYVLIRDHSDEHIAEKFSLSVPELESQIQAALKRLKQARDLRPKPRLDDKILTSWNALYLQGLVDASRYLQNDEYLKKALALGRFLQKNLKQEEGGLYRNFKENQASIPAFLDDYATLIEAYISLYEMSGETEWLEESEQLLSYCNTYFGTGENDLYFYTDRQSAPLIRRSIEVSDNVISASNSIMMLNLQRLGKIYSKPEYRKRAAAMLQRMHPQIQSHAQGHANWLHGLLHEQEEYFEIAIVGNNAESLAKDLGRHYLPNSILLWEDTESEDSSPLIQDRWVSDQTLIYVCIEGSCKLPVKETKEALAQLGNPYTP